MTGTTKPTPKTPLPSSAKLCLEELTPYLQPAGGKPRDTAVQYIENNVIDSVTLEVERRLRVTLTAEELLDQLLATGYLYEVNGTIRLTVSDP